MTPQLRRAMLAVFAGCLLLPVVDFSRLVSAQSIDPKVQPDAAKAAGDPKDSTAKKIPPDKFNMPPGAVVVLVEEAKDLRSFFPRAVILPPVKYQEMIDQISKLEKQVKGDRKTPHACKLNAVVQGDTVRIVADLRFQVDHPHATVLIGFNGSQLSEAKIRPQGDDNGWQPAIVDTAGEGYIVNVEKPGDYQMIAELRLALASGSPGAPGAERSFDVALPGAAVTTLTLELPEAVRELRWGKKNLEKPLLPATEQKHWEFAVGKLTQLQVKWKEPLAPGGTDPMRMVQGHVSVRVEDSQVVTTAELTLTDLRGRAKDWRLLLPPRANVKVVMPEGLPCKLTTPKGSLYQHLLTLLTPTADPITVTVTLTTPRAGSAKIGVGPFVVLDTHPQEGTIEVRLPTEVRRGLRLTYQPGGTLEECDPPRDPPHSEVVALFKYWDMPAPPKILTNKELAKMMLPLEIEPRNIIGKVETRLEHTLRLQPDEQGRQTVQATCKIIVHPLPGAQVDYLDVQLPGLPIEVLPLLMDPNVAGFPSALPWRAWGLMSQLPMDADWVLANAPADVELQYPDATSRIQRKVRVKWSQTQNKEFAVTLVSAYSLPAGMQKVRLELPRPVGSYDRGGKGTFEVGDTLELLTLDGGPELPAPQAHSLKKNWERAPIFWDLAWRDHPLDFSIQSVVDVAIRPRQAVVKHEFVWDQADRPHGSNLVRFLVPPEAKGLKVSAGGKLVGPDRDKHVAWVDVGDAAGKGRIVLEYDFALLATGDGKNPAPQIRVPLLWPDQATRVSTKLRMWSYPGVQPSLAEPSLAELVWKDAGIESVPGHDNLPVRVLQSEGKEVPRLFLRLEVPTAKLPVAVIDRVLVQVNVNAEGMDEYRVRYLLTKLHAVSLEVRMPVPLASLAPSFLLDGKAVEWRPRDSTGLVAKLNVDPNLFGKTVILEVNYQVAHGQPTRDGWWQTTLHPPVIEGEIFLGKVRWQTTLAPTLLAVAVRGDTTTEHAWRWHGWLPNLEPAVSSSDLELWLTGQEQAIPAGTAASLVSLRGTLEPLQIVRVPRAIWFLICSGTILAIGLVLLLYPPSAWRGVVIASVGLIVAAGVGWLWPAMLSAIFYGAAPGLVVLSMLFLCQWLLHERYKRHLVFMPGFTRVKDGSALIKPTGIRRGREASTIDAPRPLQTNLPESDLKG